MSTYSLNRTGAQIDADLGLARSAVQPGAIGVTVQGYDADTAKTDVAQTFVAAQTFNQTLTVGPLATEPTYGANLLTNGDFSAGDTGWTLGAGWAITGGQAVLTAGAGALSTTVNVTSGVTYQVDWTRVSGSIWFSVRAGTTPTANVPSYAPAACTFVANATGSVTLTFTPAGTSTGTIDNVQVRQVLTAGGAVVECGNDAAGLSAHEMRVTDRGLANVAVGRSALQSNTTGCLNAAAGQGALQSNTTGVENTAVGQAALLSNTTGYRNAAAGQGALQNNTTGYRNAAVGFFAGGYAGSGTTANQTSDSSLYLGYQTRASANGNTNEIVIGYNVVGLGSNTTIIGNGSTTLTGIKGNCEIGTANGDGIILKSPDGTRYKLTVANGGTLAIAAA